MSERNIEVVRDIYELFYAGDIAGILDTQAEDTVWDHSGPDGSPLNRVFEGHSGVQQFFDVLGATQDVVRFEVNEVLGAGDRVVSLGFMKLRVKTTGKEWESEWATVWTFRDGLVTRWRPILDMSAETAAFRD